MSVDVISYEPADRAMSNLNVPLSPAVRHGNLIYVSGQPPIDFETGSIVQGSIEVQARAVFENLRSILEAANSALEQVIRTTVYCTSSDHYRAVNDIYAEYFGHHRPARTFVPVNSFPLPFDIEIECIAATT